MDRVSMCWIQNEPVVNGDKEAKIEKSIEVHDKSEEKNDHDHDTSDGLDDAESGSESIRAHAEDETSEETKTEKVEEYDQKENRSANTLHSINFKIKKGIVMYLCNKNAFLFYLDLRVQHLISRSPKILFRSTCWRRRCCRLWQEFITERIVR